MWWQLIESWKKLVRTTAPQPPTPHPTLLATRSPAFDNVCSLCCPQTLVGFFALLKPGSVLQVISAFVVSATFSLLVGVAMPYRDTSDDYFAKACSYALTMLFFFVTVLKMGVLTEQVDSYLTDELRYRFSFDAAFVSGGMIISIVGTLPLAAAIAAHRLLQATRIQEHAHSRGVYSLNRKGVWARISCGIENRPRRVAIDVLLDGPSLFFLDRKTKNLPIRGQN